jgi:hypothetical protein
MGEDTKLGHFVALNFLPEECGENRHALKQFNREARADSAIAQDKQSDGGNDS